MRVPVRELEVGKTLDEATLTHIVQEFFEPKLENWTYLEHMVLVLHPPPYLQRAHGFVDDYGAKRPNMPINLRATALYQNNARWQVGKHAPYTNLAKDPGRHIESRYPAIFGTMIYWPHALPGWEPDGDPWPEYAR